MQSYTYVHVCGRLRVYIRARKGIAVRGSFAIAIEAYLALLLPHFSPPFLILAFVITMTYLIHSNPGLCDVCYRIVPAATYSYMATPRSHL
jgi:hypothetical protein